MPSPTEEKLDTLIVIMTGIHGLLNILLRASVTTPVPPGLGTIPPPILPPVPPVIPPPPP